MRRHAVFTGPALVLLAASARADVSPPDAVRWSARMPDERLKVGERYRVPVKLRINAQKGYKPLDEHEAFLLQLSAPDCVRLVVTDRRRPRDTLYQRQFVNNVAYVDFTLRKKPKPGDFIALNLCGYLSRKRTPERKGDQWFVRRRGNLLLERRAELRPTDSNRSMWGDRPGRLEIGDEAPTFALPDVEGNVHDLRDYIGRHHIVLAMFRHHDDQFCYAPLMNLHLRHESFDRIGAKVIAVAKEDRSLEDLNRLVRRFAKQPPYVTFLLDLGGEATRRYDPITYYLIDKQGLIRQIMPGTKVLRPTPRTLLNELAVLVEEEGPATQPADEPAATQPAETDEAVENR